ncbi:hypothetical protein XL14_23580, partial [Salmonella enterica subsp. enterica serovar Paratyphi B]|nr:hypothetical protein [Salmonella enterica subsp. enterica serovar Paratyphi B]
MAAPASQAQVLREATELIRNRMPPGWKVEPSRMGDRGNATVDARFTVSAPDGRQVDVVVEVKSGAPAGREARGLAHALHERAVAENAIPMLFARYLAPQVRDELGRIGVSFADTTGNLELS